MFILHFRVPLESAKYIFNGIIKWHIMTQLLLAERKRDS